MSAWTDRMQFCMQGASDYFGSFPRPDGGYQGGPQLQGGLVAPNGYASGGHGLSQGLIAAMNLPGIVALGPGSPSGATRWGTIQSIVPWAWMYAAVGHSEPNSQLEVRRLTAMVLTRSTNRWNFVFRGARPSWYTGWNSTVNLLGSVAAEYAQPFFNGYQETLGSGNTAAYRPWQNIGIETWAYPSAESPGIVPFSGAINPALVQDSDGFLCAFQVRVIPVNPSLPINRSAVRFIAQMGYDFQGNTNGMYPWDYAHASRNFIEGNNGRWVTVNPDGSWQWIICVASGNLVPGNNGYRPPFAAAAGVADYSGDWPYNGAAYGGRGWTELTTTTVPIDLIAYYSEGGVLPPVEPPPTPDEAYVHPGAATLPVFGAKVVSGYKDFGPKNRASTVAPSWGTPPVFSVVIGGTIAGTVTASGTPAPTYTKVSGPPWLTINSSTGALGGTATDTSPTIYNAVLRATNTAGTADLEILIRVVEGVVITTTSMPGGAVGTAYLALIAVAGTGPFTWSLDSASSASLAAIGLSLGGGSVFGSDPIAGTATFTVRATDPSGAYDEATLTITIGAAGTAPTITTTSLPTGTVGTAYSASIAADGQGPFDWSLEAGSLPPGLSLVPALDWDVALTGAAMKAAIGDPTAFGWSRQNFALGSEALVPGQNGWTLGPNLVYNGQIGTLDGSPAHQFTSNSAGNSYLNQAVSGFSVGDIVTVSFLCDTDQGTCWTTQNGIQYGVIDKTLVATGVWRWRMLVLVTSGSTMVVHAGRIDAPAANVWKATRVLVNRGINVGTYVKTTNAAIGTSHTPGWTVPGTAEARLPASTRASVAWEVTQSEVIGPPLLLGQMAIAGSPSNAGGTWTLGAGSGVRWFFDASVPIHGAATYRVTFTVVSVTGGVVPDWNDAADAAITAPGTYVREYNSYAYGPTTRFFDLQTGAGQAAVVRVDSIQLVVARAGELVPAAHNLFLDSWRLSTANGWDVGPNLTPNGLDGKLNGWPAWKFTSLAVGNSYVGKSFAVSAGVLYSVRFYTDVNLGGGWISMGTTNRQITYARRLIATGVYEWTASFIPAATETTAYFLIGCVDTAASTVWRASAPQWNYGAAPCAHVPTLGAAAFGSAIDWKLGNAMARRATPGTGAVAGAPGTPPTFWYIGSVAGIASSIVGTGTVDGMQYTDIRWQGTATAAGGLNAQFETSATALAAQPGEQLAVSVFAQRVGGSSANIDNTGWVLDQYTDTGAYVGNSVVWTGSPTDSALATNRTSAAFTISAGATTVRNVVPYFHQVVSIGDVVDITIRFSTPMLKRGAILLPAADALGWYQLRAENARTNNIRNSAMLGADTALPTNWLTDNGGTGTTFTVVGRSRLHGLPAVDIRVQGTPSSTNYNAIYFETFTQIAAATGQTRTTSALVARIGGTNAGVSGFGCGMNENTSGGVYVAGGSRGDTLGPEVRLHYYTRTFSGGGTVAYVTPYLIWTVASGVPIDFTIRIACPQEELGSFPSSRILTHGAAETRAIDSNVIPDTSPGFVSATGGTLVAQYDRGELVPAATYPGVVDVNWDDNNRVLVASQPSDYADTNMQIRNGGTASVSTAHDGANGLNRIAVSWSAARADASQNGAAAASDTSVTLPSTVSGAEIRIGRVDTPLGGSIRELYYRAASRGGAANVVALSGGNAPTVGDTLTVVGTPTAAMTQTLLVEAANDVGSDDQLLQLIINPAAPTGTTGGWSRWLTR